MATPTRRNSRPTLTPQQAPAIARTPVRRPAARPAGNRPSLGRQLARGRPISPQPQNLQSVGSAELRRAGGTFPPAYGRRGAQFVDELNALFANINTSLALIWRLWSRI